MKSFADMLLSRSAFSEIVMGNTAVVRAMIEAGTRVVTSYPGSPTPEIAGAIAGIKLEDRPFYFEFSTNEKVATEVAYGAAVNGHLATVFFKSVGLNVAADTFVQLSLMNLTGGMVVILGDDPGANSSQNEQDNRHLARLSYTPVFEPANPQEVYEFYKAAAKLSQQLHMPVILRLTTHVCHAKQKVAFAAWNPSEFDKTPRFDSKNGPYMPLTSLVFPMKRRALANLREVAEFSEKQGCHQQASNGSRRGIITFGLPYLSLLDALAETDKKPDILKLGLVYPLPAGLVAEFLRSHDEVFILEELDDIIEGDIKRLAFEQQIKVKIHGKANAEAWIGEYTADKVAGLLSAVWPKLLAPPAAAPEVSAAVPPRPAQMCPGCGHRSAFHAIKQALKPEDIKVADIGCHTLGFMPPYEMGQLLMCMGASTGIAAGMSLFNDSRRVVCFLGDSTFFHAGLPGIINALFNRHNITLIVMENGTTAMTGHQDHAASGRNFNQVTESIPVRKVLEGFGIKHIFEVDTYQQQKLTDMVREAVAVEGFSVVIARHPCMLKLMREQRRKENFQAKMVSINQQTCNQTHACVSDFACPTFVMHDDGTIDVNPDLCIGDGSCLQTCPAKAINRPEARQKEAKS
ncbi:MAG: Indolepyruvate oxidoreductase subunit IorA [Candidatus Rifleibacterium amylolyticum]|nr:MAG: Indolepyruvate oxidoreductase subunit IorA [Candidatus Rifleibacterium amylolyticum]